MKFIVVSSLLILAIGCQAFMPSGVRTPAMMARHQTMIMSASKNGYESRADAIQGAFRSLALAGISTVLLNGASSPAYAKDKKPEYLQEPTPEFKALQEKAMAFEKVAFEKKQVWKKRFALLEQAKTEKEIVAALDDLTKFVLEEKGLPVGIKKQALVSDIRKIKRTAKDAKQWNKDAEISYQQLTYSISYEQSPNTARDLANPL